MNQQPQINIELGEKEAEGIYCNLAIIAHSSAEFVIDFTRILPGVPKSRILSRIIMTPQHVLGLFNGLKDGIEKYEKEFGKIPQIKNAGNQQIGFSMNPNLNKK